MDDGVQAAEGMHWSRQQGSRPTLFSQRTSLSHGWWSMVGSFTRRWSFMLVFASPQMKALELTRCHMFFSIKLPKGEYPESYDVQVYPLRMTTRICRSISA